MDKIFSYSNSRKDNDLALFKSNKPEHHADLVRDLCCNTVTGYVVDTGSLVRIPRHAMHDVSRHMISRGWTLGV